MAQRFSLEGNLRGFFVEVIGETLDGRAARPSAIVQDYLVGLLEDSALSLGSGPVESTLGAPLAVQLSEALHAPIAVRFDQLRRLGDGILLLSGIYEAHLRKHGLEDRYVATLGSKAYSAASMIMIPSADSLVVGQSALNILDRLAHGFVQFMTLLRDVADTLVARSAQSAGDVARLVERWLERRTAHLERLLGGKGIPARALANLATS